MRALRLVLAAWLVFLFACGGPVPPGADGGVDAGQPYVPTQRRALGLNDVTFLLPREPLSATSAFPLVGAMLPRYLFDRLTTATMDVLTDFERLRVVAVRFDACDRSVPGVDCADDAPGSLRLVLQPVFPMGTSVEDVTFHTFYPVPRAEVPVVVDELRALAERQNVPTGAALKVCDAFASDAEFRAGLGAFVARYAKAQDVHRVTLFGQLSISAALVWVFRGQVKGPAGTFAPIEIPDIRMPNQQVLLLGGDSYQVTPIADAPAGLEIAVIDSSFRAAAGAAKQQALETLAAVDNPRLHTADTVQCVTCHVATTILAPRAADAGVDVTALASRYTAPQFDLTPLGSPGSRFRTLRALGYLSDLPLVSQRVVNESANVVQELERRFPPAP